MLVADDETQSVLTATENGYGKRTSIVEYTRHGRGTKGMIAIQQSERNGKVVAATLVRPDDEIMLITDSGVLVRTRVSEIRELGRATQGVTLIALDDGAQLIGLQRIVENDAAEEPSVEPGTDPDHPNQKEKLMSARMIAGSAAPASRRPRLRCRGARRPAEQPGEEGNRAEDPADQAAGDRGGRAQHRRAARRADDAGGRPGCSARWRRTSARRGQGDRGRGQEVRRRVVSAGAGACGSSCALHPGRGARGKAHRRRAEATARLARIAGEQEVPAARAGAQRVRAEGARRVDRRGRPEGRRARRPDPRDPRRAAGDAGGWRSGTSARPAARPASR